MRSAAPAAAFTISDEVRTFPSYHFRTILHVAYHMPHMICHMWNVNYFKKGQNFTKFHWISTKPSKPRNKTNLQRTSVEPDSVNSSETAVTTTNNNVSITTDNKLMNTTKYIFFDIIYWLMKWHEGRRELCKSKLMAGVSDMNNAFMEI